jgi:hypothetical protein
MRTLIGKDAELVFDASRLAHALPVEMPAVRRNERHEAIRDTADIGMLDAREVESFWKFGKVCRSGVGPI